VNESSWGIVKYRVVEKVERDEFPQHVDGSRYTEESFIKAWSNRDFSMPGGDYRKIIMDFDLVAKVESHAIDEVWMFVAPRLIGGECQHRPLAALVAAANPRSATVERSGDDLLLRLRLTDPPLNDLRP
jgi:hypothetical protein